MSNQTPDYHAILKVMRTELKAVEVRYIALQEGVAAIERLAGLSAGRNSTKTLEELGVVSTPFGAFDGMGNKSAVMKAMQIADKPLSTREVVQIMESAGYQHNSANFWNTVNTTLVRLAEKEGWVLKNPEGKWFLTPQGREQDVDARHNLFMSDSIDSQPLSLQSQAASQDLALPRD